MHETGKSRHNVHERLVGIQDNLLNFAYMLTSNRDDAYDLLQDTTLKVLDNQEKYTDNENFKGWAFTIMRNIFINDYRKSVRDRTYGDHTEGEFHLNQPREEAYESTEDAYDLKEIRRIIHKLPREYKMPFSLHLRGFKYREIADRLHLPLGTVKSRIFFTRQRLQRELKDFR